MNNDIELITRILCDTRPDKPLDGAYLYCMTVENQESPFRAARRLIRHDITRRILILEADAMSGYPGAVQYRKGLEDAGLTAEQIGNVPAGGLSSINTLIESEAMVRFAKEKGLDDLIVVSSPFHQLRAFMTAVTVGLRIYPGLKIYSYPGAPLPWLETAVHSQGTLQTPRRQLIHEELARINTYQKKGDLARVETVLEYLNGRDQITM